MESEIVAISPEKLEVAKTYLSSLSIAETALALGIPDEKVSEIMQTTEVKRFVDNAFLEQGYLNRFKLQAVMDEVLERKLEECEESEMYSGKDILDIIAQIHKMRIEEEKLIQKRTAPETPTNQINIQQNFGEGYSELISKLVANDNIQREG